MSVNRIQIKASLGDKKVTIPIGQSFDEVGREQLISVYEEVEQQDHINMPQDYETTQYAHDNPDDDYNMFYEFRFIDPTTGFYVTDYKAQGFSNRELAKNKKSFSNSFFKLDFFDSPNRNEQKILFTMIIPANNSTKDYEVPVSAVDDPTEYYTQTAAGATAPFVYYSEGVYEPIVQLGPGKGKNEGYYIQWLKDRELMDINTFYVACKFFNAKTGKIVRMVNKPIPNATEGIYDYLDWFYYQLTLDVRTDNTIPKYNYVFRQFNRFLYQNNMTGGQKGTSISKLTFYEYINP